MIKLFSGLRHHDAAPGSTALAAAEACLHRTLVPKWTSSSEMWQQRPPVGYACRDCRLEISLEEIRLQRLALTSRAHLKGA
jgi:hypothetical protein